jgi:hypothetical protein
MPHLIRTVMVVLCSPAFVLAALDTAAIENAAGMKGTWMDAEKVYKLTYPRESWASFMSGREKAVLMIGEVKLAADEVNPALTAALDNGIEVTALRCGDQPRAYFMNITGEGSASELAGGVKKVMEMIKQGGDESKRTSDIDRKALDAIFVVAGESSDGGYRIVIGREVSMPCACIAGKEMGVSTWAALSGTNDSATMIGQFACTYVELQPVLKALRGRGIEVTAIQNHMAAEAPRLIFVHFQKSGRAEELAKAVKAGLDAQKQAPQSEDHSHHHP